MITPINKKFEMLRRRNVPLAATIEVTKRCNARCGYCYLGDKDELTTADEMDTTALLGAVDKLCDAGVLRMTLTGGEPFLRPDILEIINRCVERECFQISIMSNGLLLNSSHIDFLKKHRSYFRLFRMSAFSHHAEINDRYMGVPGALEIIVENGMALIAAGVPTSVTINVMDFNVGELDKTIEFFRSRGIGFGIGLKKRCSSACGEADLAPMVSEEFFLQAFEKMGTPPFWARDLIQKGNRSDDQLLCLGVSKSIVITAAGEIVLCPALGDHVFGSIGDSRPLREILNQSAEFLRLRNITQKDLPCGECASRGACVPCIAVMDKVPGKIGQPNQFSCNFARAINTFAALERAA